MEYFHAPDRLGARTHDLDTHQKSLDAMRWLSVLIENDGMPGISAKAFAARWPYAPNLHLVQKAAVAAGTAVDATWGGPLSPIQPLMSAFLEYSRPLSILGRLQLRKVPFNVGVPMMTAPTAASWVGEGLAKPITKGSLVTVTLGITKVVDIIIETAELVKLLVPDAAIALRDDLAASIAAFVDSQFCDPAVVGVPGVSPPSITAGLTPLASSGTTAAAVVVDVDKLIGAFLAQNPNTSTATILMTPSVASMLVSATKSQTLTIDGGRYAGVSVVTSASVGSRIIMIDPSSVLLADGGAVIDASRQTTLQMDSLPDSPPTGATVEVSLWQYGLIALRCERYLNWKRARTSAVALVSPTAYVSGT